MLSIVVDFFKSIRIINVFAILFAQVVLSRKLTIDINIAIVITFCLSSMGYLQNNFLDYKLDTFGKKKVNLFIKSNLKFINHWILFIQIAVLLSSIYFFFLGSKIHSFMLICNWILLNLYNHYLKKYAFIGNLIVALLSMNAVLYIFWIQNSVNSSNLLFLSFILVLSLLREIVKDIEDKEADIQYNYKTIPILFSQKMVTGFCFILSIIIIGILTSLNFSIMGKISIIILLILQGFYTFKNRFSVASTLLKIVFFIGIFTLWVGKQ